jgi:peptidyl-prolyl cis-trans isomerase A (cyclophilin A)
MKQCVLILCGLGFVMAFQANSLAQTPITNEPQSITVNNASTAMFTVGASNATNYQWQFNTTNLSDGTQPDGVIITGSATASLTLEDVTTNEAGNYTVVVNGSVTNSPAAVLAVLTNGTIVQLALTGFIGGGISNVQVQLFDHDKPATVQNFLHHIRAGVFTNMFFQRDVSGYLQGGSFGTTDLTNTNPPITGWDVASYIASNGPYSPPFPPQVDNEYNVGPLIRNDFGTIAMALSSGDPDSATSGFFFNLTDNSGLLDAQDFTVFGRILNNSNEITSSNVLAYFYRLTNESGTVANADFSDYGSLDTNQPFPTLPVNYAGSNAPANSNLVFCSFSFLATNPPDTTLPTVSITSPAAPEPVTNLQGTASDDVGLAVVICVLTPQAATDGTYPYPYANTNLVTNYAVGTTNWSLNLSPGSYTNVSVQSQDGAGNLSPATNQPLVVTYIVTNGNGTVTFTNGAVTNFNAVGYPFQEESNYDLVAIPGANELFVSWNNDYATNDAPELSYSLDDGILTATFISNSIPNGIAITYPAANAVVSSGTFNVTGTISTNIAAPPVTVTCTIFSQTDGFSVSPSMTTIGTNTWSIPVTNLSSGFYTVGVTATDSSNNTTEISENFSVGTLLQLTILGEGTVSGVTNGEYVPVGTNFQVTATPGAGALFYAWNDGTAVFTNSTETFTMSSNLALTVEFVSSDVPKVISFSYPTANAKLNTNTFPLKVRLASSAKSARVTCQIFSLTTTNANEVFPPLSLTETGANIWSATVSNLPPNEYEVEAVATYDMKGTNTSSAAFEKFYVLYFKQVEGTYTGLFTCYSGAPVDPTNSGFFTCTVTASGAFSARLLFPAYEPLVVSSGFDVFGYTGTYTWLIPGNPVSMELSLDLTGGLDELTGYVYATNESWVSSLTCYRAVTKLSDATPAKGKYIFSLDPTGWSNIGYASLSVGSSGTLALSGALPDGASFSQSARISKDGVWPLYVVPAGYKSKGMLMGWETWQTNGSGSYTGPLSWYKAPNVGTYYTNGINTNVNSTGTNYVPPAAGSYSIVFQEGTNSVLGSNDLSVAHAGAQFKPESASDTNKLAISLSASGILTGHFITNSDSKPLQFKGAFFGQSQGDSGFVLDGDGQTGYFLLDQLEPQ